MFRAYAESLRAFARETKGNVALLFGVALIPLVIGVGMAVDYGRVLVVRERMADAADAAGLAIGSWAGLTQNELKTKAQQFFNANYPPTALGTVGNLNVTFVGDDIQVDVSGKVPTTFMKLANVNSIDVGVSNLIRKKERFIEVVLVLDVMGSMNSSGKLDAMKTAAKKMIDVLFEGKSTSDTLKIGLVPYSGAVRIGSDKLNSGWLDKATYSSTNATSHPLAFEDYDKVNGISALNLYSAMGRQWPGCVRERGGAYEISDAAPDQNIPASLFVPYLAPDEPSRTQNNRCRTDGNYANDYICEDDVTATCVKPAPSGASNADKEDYERQCRTGKYKSFSGSGPEYNCPPAAAAVTAMTNVKSTITNAINALQADGYTVIPAGLLWGWRVISPGAPYTEGAAYNDEKWIKAVVLLTDGQNDVNGGSNGINKSAYNAFGYAKNGHLGSVNGSQAEAKLDEKTLLVCSAIKNQNPDNPILLYTIGFQVSTSSQNLLRNCATKPDMYYNSPSNDQLTAIFQEIAQGLSELRIAQ